jgi:hypothetical protein
MDTLALQGGESSTLQERRRGLNCSFTEFVAFFRLCERKWTMPDARAPLPSTVVADNYIKFKHEFLEFLFAELVDMRTIFEGDLDTLLIFISISRYYLRDERSHPGAGDADFGAQHHLTLSRIADITRIPRETVRRKLKQLEARGLLERGANDNWRLTVRDGQPVIRTTYEDVWRREMQRLVKLVRSLRADVPDG